MKKALIFQGRIVEVASTTFPVSPDMVWVDAPNDATIETHVYDGAAVVAKPPKPLSEAKAEKLAQLEAARKAAIANLPPVTVAGKQYPANSEYREVISNLARRMGAGRPVPSMIRGVGGVAATLSAALVQQIDDAIAAAVQAQWDNYWAKVDAVNNAATVADVEAVVW